MDIGTSDSPGPETCGNCQQGHNTSKNIGCQWWPEDILWYIYEIIGSEMTAWEKPQYRYESKKDGPVENVSRFVTHKRHVCGYDIAQCSHDSSKSVSAVMARRSRSLEYFSAAACLAEANGAGYGGT
jgi:hypothetical protein